MQTPEALRIIGEKLRQMGALDVIGMLSQDPPHITYSPDMDRTEAVLLQQNQNPRPANRRSTRPGCEWAKTPIVRAYSVRTEGGAPTAKTETNPAPYQTNAGPRTVGAPAPGANGCLPAPYPVIGKPGPLHKLGVPDISTIQQQRLVHLRMQTLEVRAPVGLPLSHQHQRISAGGGFIGIVMQDQIIPLPRPGRQCRQRAGIM